MKIFGLGTNPKVQNYLRTLEGVRDVSVFETLGTDRVSLETMAVSKRDETYIGGFKGFYSVTDSDTAASLVAKAAVRRGFEPFTLSIATPNNVLNSKVKTFLLDLGDATEESRMLWYSKKTRNQVKNARESALTLAVSSSMGDAYTVYADTIKRLGNNPRLEDWFKNLESFLGTDIVCITASIGQNVIGVNYAIRAGDYIMLMFNASTQEGKDLNVNNLLYDELVRWAIENKLKWVDFGPSVEKDKTHIHFKLGFGATEWYLSQKTFGSLRVRLSKWFAQKRYNLKLRTTKRSLAEQEIDPDAWKIAHERVLMVLFVAQVITVVVILVFVFWLQSHSSR